MAIATRLIKSLKHLSKLSHSCSLVYTTKKSDFFFFTIASHWELIVSGFSIAAPEFSTGKCSPRYRLPVNRVAVVPRSTTFAFTFLNALRLNGPK